ncbi:MAG TPA: hypothetical protein VHA06_00920 [Candidatus Angelobacter sp.]|jgi:hypothetical protein|nr:hypothetical protein [Candidatus Angelobacter sp.]
MIDIDLELDEAARRAGSHWETDGLPILLLAIMMLLTGLLLSHMNSTQPFLLDLLFFGLIFLAVLLLGWKKSPVVRWLKSRITYPRTGYVALPPFGSPAAEIIKQESWKHHPEMIVIGFTPALPDIFQNPWIGSAIIVAAVGLLLVKTRARFPLAGFFIPGILVIATTMAILPIAKGHRMSYLFVAYGFLYLIGGLKQLLAFLDEHPAPQT